jgi:hypothetical protein
MGSVMITDAATFEAVHDLMDQVQRLDRKVSALCEQAGIDPGEAGRLPGEAAPQGVTDLPLPAARP